MADDYEWMGASAEVVAQIRAEARGSMPDTGFAVHPANETAVRLFLALATQWRCQSLSTMARAVVVRTGLDYAAIEPTARMAGLDLVDDDFARLRLLEAEALIEQARGVRARMELATAPAAAPGALESLLAG